MKRRNGWTLRVSALAMAVGMATGVAFAQPLLQPADEPIIDGQELPIPDEAAATDPLAEPANNPGGEPGYLGVVADDRAEQGRGVRVLDVVAGAPAENGGLKKNDLITAIDGRKIANMDAMAGALSGMPAGSLIVFTVSRNGAVQDVNVTLGERPAPADRKFQNFGRQPEDALPELNPGVQTLPGKPKLGVRTLPITADLQEQLRLGTRDGAFVVSVSPGSPAEQAGVPIGAVITSLDGQPVRTPDALAGLVSRAAARGSMVLGFIADGQAKRAEVNFGGGGGAIPAEDPFAAPAPSESTTTPAPPRNELPIQSNPIPSNDDDRISGMERRLSQLEDRLQRIEELLEAKAKQ